MTYQHQKPPEDAKSLPAYLDRELSKVEQEFFAVQDFAQLRPLHVAPAKPRDGMVVCADGTDWAPLGAGGGFFGYLGGVWLKLG
jgi:hypothetical protein